MWARAIDASSAVHTFCTSDAYRCHEKSIYCMHEWQKVIIARDLLKR